VNPNDEGEEPRGPEGERAASGEDSGLDGVRQKVKDLANRWLEDRFALREGEAADTVRDLGARAETFVRGFFRGLFDKTEDAPGEAGRPGLGDITPALDEAARVISRTGRTLQHTLQDYLREKADPSAPDAPVVIDGRFVVRHGTELFGRLVQALGGAIASPAAEPPPDEAPRVPVKVDFAGLFRSLVVGAPPSSGAPAATAPRQATPAAAAPSVPEPPPELDDDDDEDPA